MATTSGHTIPLEALVSFHALERRLFVRMAFQMGVNPTLAMEIIAFWMWLEEAGHPSVIRPILELPDDAIRPVAVEAKKCVAGLPDPTDPVAVRDVVHATFTARGSPVSLSFVNSRRHYALHGVIATLTNVCVKIFDDLVGLLVVNKNKAVVFGPHGEGSSRMGESTHDTDNSGLPGLSPSLLSDGATEKLSVSMRDGILLSNLVNMPRSIHLNNCMQMMGSMVPNLANPNLAMGVGAATGTPVAAGGAGASVLSLYKLLMGQQQSNLNPLSHSCWRPPQKEVPRDERTLFVTFSNGYPLKEENLREFFARHFGPIEVIYIQQVLPGEEPLFARIVFNLQETVLLLLNGNEKVKFVIKGKHVWARRYIPKKKRRSNEV